VPALTSAERREIHSAADQVYRRCGVEIAVVAVPASDHYRLYPILWASIGALTISAVLALFFRTISLRAAALAQAITWLTLALICEPMPIRVRLVPRHIRRALAHALARHQFAAHMLSGDPSRRFILIFVSIAEHYIEVIADRRTLAATADGTWKAIVANFARTVKAGALANALLEAVERCAAAVAAADTAPPAENQSG
jgi:putative membrane protein